MYAYFQENYVVSEAKKTLEKKVIYIKTKCSHVFIWVSTLPFQEHIDNSFAVTCFWKVLSITIDSRIQLRPTEHTFGSLITATSLSSGSSAVLDQVFVSVLKSGCSSDLYVGSALVSAFARHGLIDEAKDIFLSFKKEKECSHLKRIDSWLGQATLQCKKQ